MAEMCSNIDFEGTELRLGLPKPAAAAPTNSNGKRGFDDCDEDDNMDLKLNLSSLKETNSRNSGDLMLNRKDERKETSSVPNSGFVSAEPPPKAPVVGWPPVRSFRKSILAAQKSGTDDGEKTGGGHAAFVKVSVDGAPYLRKVDLKTYRSYQDLSSALANMFSSFTIGKCGSEGTTDFVNESKLMDISSDSDYVPTYEDKDGDWMLVGDVPWEMFVDSCKRLRIMKGKEAIGLAPRAMEKCKNRT